MGPRRKAQLSVLVVVMSLDKQSGLHVIPLVPSPDWLAGGKAGMGGIPQGPVAIGMEEVCWVGVKWQVVMRRFRKERAARSRRTSPGQLPFAVSFNQLASLLEV